MLLERLIHQLLNHQDFIDSVLKKGAEKALNISTPILKQTYELVGFLSSKE